MPLGSDYVSRILEAPRVMRTLVPDTTVLWLVRKSPLGISRVPLCSTQATGLSSYSGDIAFSSLGWSVRYSRFQIHPVDFGQIPAGR